MPAYLSNHISGTAVSTAVSKVACSASQLGKTSAAGLALTLGLIVTGCATAPDTVVVEPAPKVTEAPEAQPPVVKDTPKKDPVQAQPDGQSGEKQPDGMVSVSVYTIDDECNNFIEETVEVPGDVAIEEAVGKAMDSEEYNAFKLGSYEVNITGSTAIVDMQLAPGSERQFVSLSSCEQRSLFGSIEETLKNNADWAIDNVKFTDNGKDLIL